MISRPSMATMWAKEAGLSEEEVLAVIANSWIMHGQTPCSGQESQVWALMMGQPVGQPKPDVAINVENQEKDPNSILNYYRQLTALYRHPLYQNGLIRFGEI